jgi:2-polyprenyl-6-methoxyphenol hydroxylase-like FAD-dependent oxidoreductase
MTPNDTVIIAGGGIAGVSVAPALRDAGIQTTVLERAPRPIEAGAGVTLHFSSMIAAERLGAADAIRAAGVGLERQLIVTARGVS